MDNRRRQDRKYLSFFSRVIDRYNGRLLGYLADLTTGGAMLVGNIPLKTGEVFHLRVDLPEDFTTRDQLDLEAKAVWSKPDIDPEFYRTGLQLVDIQPEDLLILERLLSDYGVR
ncbi:MAG: PilZ domain-containing protein [Anaerolineales bacterium]|nr:PilZ domain-containing protein [Anaerolineales bacterium]